MGWRWANIRPRNSSSSRQPSSRSTARIHGAPAATKVVGGSRRARPGRGPAGRPGTRPRPGGGRRTGAAASHGTRPARASARASALRPPRPRRRKGERAPGSRRPVADGVPDTAGRARIEDRASWPGHVPPFPRPCAEGASIGARPTGRNRLRAPGRGWTAGRAGRRGRTRPGGSGVYATRLSHLQRQNEWASWANPGRPWSWAAVRTGVAPRDLPTPAARAGGTGAGKAPGCW